MREFPNISEIDLGGQGSINEKEMKLFSSGLAKNKHI